MIVVADTSPLNYLLLLDQAQVLQDIYGRVLVPHAVLLEMQHPDAPAEVREWASAPPSWVELRRVQHLDLSLPLELGAGEREAISLALEVQADLLLIDERAGRAEAEARGLAVAGTLAVLLRAGLLGKVHFPEALQRLRQVGFRFSPAVETAMMTRYDQTKK